MRPVFNCSETCIERTPSIKWTVAEVHKFISLIYFKWNLYSADTSIKRTRTPKKYLKWSFLLLPTCIKRTLVIKFHHPTCQTPEMRKIAIYKFFNFYIKKRDLTNLFNEFHSTVLFSISFCLYRDCFTHPSSNLSCNLYMFMVLWSTGPLKKRNLCKCISS